MTELDNTYTDDICRYGGDNLKQIVSIIFFFVFAASAVAQTGTIEITVYNQNTQKTLENAEVHLIESDLREKSDAEGKVWFTGIPPGTYSLSISHTSFSTPINVTVEVTAGQTTQTRISLGEVFELETVVVEGERIPPTISRKDIRGSELLRIAGVGTDALKGLTTLPSIGIPNDFFGILYIRGSEPGSNLYYLDRTQLGYPFHWGGFLSTISSETIDKIDIYAGGYGAEFGLDSQAVLDIQTRDSLENRLDGKFNLNVLYSEGLLEGRIGENGYFSVSGRRSYFDLIAGPIIEAQTGTEQQFPYFSDYQIKLNYELKDRHALTVNVFAATDHFNIRAEAEPDPDNIEPDVGRAGLFFKNGFAGQGIHLHSKFLDNRLASYLSLTRTLNTLKIDLKDPVVISYKVVDEHAEFKDAVFVDGKLVAEEIVNNSYDIKIDVPVYTLREDIIYKMNPSLQLESGFLLSFSPANSYEDGRFYEYELVEDNRKGSVITNENGVVEEKEYFRPRSYEITDLEETHFEFGHDFYRAETYGQVRYNPLQFVSIALGARLDYLDLTKELSIQPRGSINVVLPNDFNLRFAYGQYEQSPKPYQLLSENGNPALKSSIARHYIVEIENEITQQTDLKFATYYKDTQNMVINEKTTGQSSQTLVVSEGEGLAIEDAVYNFLNQGSAYVGGVEAFLRHRIPDRFFGWVSYSWTHAEQRERTDALYNPYLFDNTHIVSIVANYSFTENTEMGLKWQYLSGTSEVPISSLLLIQDPVTRGLNPLLASVDEEVHTALTPYHKLDFRISHKWKIKGVKLGGFFDVLNLYNRKNTIKFILNESTIIVQDEEIVIQEWESEEVQQLPLIIYVGLTLEF